MDVNITNVLTAFVGMLVLRKLISTTQIASDYSRVGPQTMDHTEAQGAKITSNGPYVSRQ